MAARQTVWFHGTSETCAATILETGFKAGTYYAAHLEDALAFGGPHVFMVGFTTEHEDWQVCLSNAMRPDAIIRYTVYENKVVLDKPLDGEAT